MDQINYGLLDTTAPGRIATSFQTGQQNALAMRSAKQQQQLNALQIDRAKRESEAEGAIKNALAGGDIQAAQQTLLKGGYYKQAQELQKQISEQRAAKIEESKQRIDITKQALNSVYNNPTPESTAEALDFIDQTFGDPNVTAKHRQDLARIGNNPEGIKQWAGQHLFSADEMLSKIKYEDAGPVLAPVETNPRAPGYNPQPIRKGLSPGERARVDRGESSGTPYYTPVQSAQGVYAFNNRTGQMEPIAVGGKAIVGSSSDPELQARITAEKAAAEAKAKSEAEAKIAMSGIVAEADQTVKLVDDIIKHPGMKMAVGASSLFPAGKIPGTESRDFINRLDQLKGKQFLQAFQSLKGGGQITEVEGQKATDAISRMKTSSSEQEFIAAANEFKDIVQKGAQRAKEKAGISGKQMTQAPSMPPVNASGWTLHTDANGNKAYVSPDGKQFEEVK